MTFPSWSWAGWDTAVEIEGVAIGHIHPEVEWFVISQNGETIQVVTHGCDDYGGQPKATPGNRMVGPPTGLPGDFLETVQHQADTCCMG